jgi:pimeloyl-ACP methyl ester carboxylesterase
MTQRLRSTDGTPIAVETVGQGPAVVLVDGAFGNRASGPNVATASLLAPRFTVYRYDRRGRGGSGEIEDLNTLIEAAGGFAHVFGTSSGGNLALRAAASGLWITKLAVWEPNFIADGARPPLPGDYVDHLNELVGSNRRGDAVAYFMTAAVGVPAEFVAPMRHLPMWPTLEAAAHTLAYDGTIVAQHMSGSTPSAEEWSAVTMPTLVLDGASSPWLSVGADALVDALPNARRRTLAGQQHDVEAVVLAPALIEFFEGGW